MVSPHGSAVREANDRHVTGIDRLAPEEAVDLAERRVFLPLPNFPDSTGFRGKISTHLYY
jgi:hypothetical protein